MVSYLVIVALSGALAEPPPPPRESATKTGVAFAVGAAIDAVSFAVGVGLAASDAAGLDQSRAGWITCSAGLALGPFVAHAMIGQWARGALFSAVPLAGTIGNAIVLGSAASQSIDVTPLNQDQRFIVLFTSIGLLGSVIGLIDVAVFKPTKTSVRIAPTLSRGGAGLVLGGAF